MGQPMPDAGLCGIRSDYLICAVAATRRGQIFSTDANFARYRKCIPIRLYGVLTGV